ncbi:DUF1697 domain-containing protein [Christiangramia salexigens]|nr:DUF1697 domain-containing protein [Christiangramia salexigens]
MDKTYIAFLRGINVGGHHKVPMADLCTHLESLGFTNIVTLLNSGNIIFNAAETEITKLEDSISESLEERFGFPIPVIIRTQEDIQELYNRDPFHGIAPNQDLRLFVSFLKQDTGDKIKIPMENEDKSFQIIDKCGGAIISILDISKTSSPIGMKELEKIYGSGITTRNWNTIVRLESKLRVLG